MFPSTEAPAENAHHALEAARSLLEADDLEVYRALHYRLQREILKGGAEPTAEDLELFRRALEHYGPVLDLLDSALSIESARFDFDRGLPSFDQLPFLNAFEMFADLYCARAHLAMAEGRTAEAWRQVNAIFRLASWSSQEMPILASQLMAFSTVRFAAFEAEALLQTAVPDREAMGLLLAEAQSWDPHAALELAMWMDRAEMVAWLSDPTTRERLVEAWFPEVPGWLLRPPFEPWLRLNLATYTEAMGKLSADCLAPGHERPVVIGRPGRLRELYPTPFWATLARSLLSENYFDACNRRDIAIAIVDLMEIAFRLEDHRRQHGDYPSDLSHLAQVPQVDPFSGRPYRYRLADRGAVVYSVSINRTDDGGVPPPILANRDQDRYAGDLVWRLGT